jgi:hypothetical protein
VVTENSFLYDPRYRRKRHASLNRHAAGVRRASGFVLVGDSEKACKKTFLDLVP